jgi:membrane protein DedA with SNARE-associated domain
LHLQYIIELGEWRYALVFIEVVCADLVVAAVVKPEEGVMRVVGVHNDALQGMVAAPEHQIHSELQVVQEQVPVTIVAAVVVVAVVLEELLVRVAQDTQHVKLVVTKVHACYCLNLGATRT